MSKEIEKLINQQAKRQNLPIQYLRDKIYPELYQALVMLIDHIIKTDEIRKHQERLKRKKVFDKLEQKKVEKQKLKEDLGSDYVSSEDDSLDFEDLGLEKEELEKILNERKKAKEDQDGDDKQEDGEDSESYNKSKNNIQSDSQDLNGGGQKDKGNKENLVLIEENEEKDEENEKDITAEREKITKELKQQREDLGFNPLKFLAEKLKEIHSQQN
ncbi:hypothetical protein ABPG74_009387 [Tetrahymena malaccensis]